MDDFANVISDAGIFARSIFASDSSGHDFNHTKRVANISRLIQAEEGGDLVVISLAAWLHDVDDPKLFETADMANARGFMKRKGVPDIVADAVCHVISQVSFKAGDTVVPDTLEGKIVQDADRLDAIGAIGIARAFAYGGSRGNAIYDPLEKPLAGMGEEEYRHHKGCTINHFHEKLLLLKDMMNTPTARILAEKRDFFMRTFLSEFLSEWNYGQGQ